MPAWPFPGDLAPQDWHRLATIISLAAAAVALLAYCFGGYVAGRRGGGDGLRHGLRVLRAGRGAARAARAARGGHAGAGQRRRRLHSAGAAPSPGEGIRFGDVAVKAATWSLITMLLGSLAGGVLGERAHRRRHHSQPENAQGSGRGSA